MISLKTKGKGKDRQMNNKQKLLGCIVSMMLLTMGVSYGQSKFSLCGAVTPYSRQTTVAHQGGLPTPYVQLLPPADVVGMALQLQMVLNAIEGELSQNEIFQQQQFSLMMSGGMGLCPQCPRTLVMPINDGGMPVCIPFPGVPNGRERIGQSLAPDDVALIIQARKTMIECWAEKQACQMANQLNRYQRMLQRHANREAPRYQ